MINEEDNGGSDDKSESNLNSNAKSNSSESNSIKKTDSNSEQIYKYEYESYTGSHKDDSESDGPDNRSNSSEPNSSRKSGSNSETISENDSNKSKSLNDSDFSSQEKTNNNDENNIMTNIQKILTSTKFINYDIDLGSINNLNDFSYIYLIQPNYEHIYVQSLSLPPSVQTIKINAFKKCLYFDQIIFIKNSKEQNFLNFIGEKAFINTKMQSIVIPENIEEIQSNCFPRTLKSIDFEKGAPKLSVIGDKVFYHNDLETFSMPININAFIKSKNTFLMCKNLKTLIFDKNLDFDKLVDVNYDDDEKDDVQKMIAHNITRQKYLNQWKSFLSNIPKNLLDEQLDETDFKFKLLDEFYDKLRESKEERIFQDEDDSNIMISEIGYFKINDFAKSLLLSQINLQNLEVFCSNLNKFFFYNTPNLVNITIPKSDNARYVKIDGCLYTKNMKKLIVAERNIKSVVINSKCKIITNYALSFESLEKVDFEENSEIEEISFFVFSKSNIKSLTVPNSVKSIHYAAFYECSKLESVTLPKSINYLDFFTFACSNLYEIIIPNNVLKIDFGCFYKCFNLTEVKFQENSQLLEIEDFAFAYTNIDCISIPKSVIFISSSSFAKCNNLKSVIFDEKSQIQYLEWNSTLKALVSKKENSSSIDQKIFKNGLYYEDSMKSLVDFDFSAEKVDIAKETKIIKENALKFSNIVKIDFEPGCQLKEIEKSAFECLQISEISIPNSCTIIGDSVFSCCKSLKKVHIDSKSQLESIGNHAFEGTSIETITFPSTLTTIGDYAFFECFDLVSVNNHSKKINFGCRSFSRSAIESIKFPQEAIFHNMSFSECMRLHHLHFNREPTNLIFEESSFALSGLEDLNLNCICELQEKAFAFCVSLKEVKITRKESKIHQTSFYNSNNIQIFLINCTILDIDKLFYDYISSYVAILNSARYKLNRNKYNYGIRHYIDIFQGNHIYRRKSNFFIDKERQKNENPDEKSKDWFYSHKLYDYLLNFEKIILNVYYSGIDGISKTSPQSYISNKNYHIIDNILKYVNLIDNISLFEKPDEESNKNEIKKNEILNVSNMVKKLDFQPTPHIKKIIWEPNCIVNDLGPPGFFSYSNLIEIEIPKLVEKIPPHLFEKCNFLRTVTFENKSILSEIGEFSFANTKIDKVIFPKTVQIIHKSAFMNVISLEKVQFYGKIIEDEAFLGTGITSFEVPNKTNSIGNYAFQYCHSLSTIIIDPEKSNLSNIGSYAFAETSITKMNIPSKISIIKKGTFSGCGSLKEVQISANTKLVKIEQCSFAGNLLLQKINIPSTIEYVSHDSFINTPSLEFIMTQSNKHFIVLNDYSVYSPKKELIFVPRNIESYKIIPKCKVIHEGAFCGPKLKSVIFSDESLRRIEKGAFAHSTGLENISIPKSISFIGEEAFIDCQNLENVDFNPSSKLLEIPKFCFAFSGVKKVQLPILISIINDSSFLFCQNLKYINLEETELAYIGHYAFSYTNLDVVKFPSLIEYIGYHAFHKIDSLKLVDFSLLGQIRFEEMNYVDKYKEIFKNSKDCLKKVGHIIERFNMMKVITSNNNQFIIGPPVNKNNDSKPKNKKPSYTILSNKTISKSSKKSKTSAEIIKPVVKSKISKSKKTIAQNSNVHQISQPSIEKPRKSPRRLFKIKENIDTDDNQPISLLYKKTEKKYTKTKEEHFEEFFDENYNDIFEKKYNETFEEIWGKNKVQEVLEDENDGKRIIRSELVKKSKKSNSKLIIQSDNNEMPYNKQINKDKIVTEKHTKKMVKIPFEQNIHHIQSNDKKDFTNVYESQQNNIETNEVDEEECEDDNMKIDKIIKIKHEKENLEKKIRVKNEIIKNLSDFEENEDERINKENEKAQEEEEEEEENENIIEEEFGFEDSSSEDIFSTCYFHKSAFYDSTIQVFMFNLSEYQWFHFFDYCKDIKEYIVNSNLHLYVKKRMKKNLKRKNILGSYYKCIKLNDNLKPISFRYTKVFIYSNSKFFVLRYPYELYNLPPWIYVTISKYTKLIKLNSFNFLDFSQLTSITLDDNVDIDEIPNNCFFFSSIEEIRLPINIQRINKCAFKDCNSLKKVTIPKKCKLTALHSFSFHGCKKLKLIYIPKKVKQIYQNCFSFSGLESIELPGSICKIRKNAFSNCKNLSKITLNEGILEIGNTSFANNESLKSIILPNSLRTIRSNAFSNCINLTKVKTSKYTQLIKIYNGAFENTQIEELKINRSARILFEPTNVPKLNKITFCQGEPIDFIQDNNGVIYKKIEINATDDDIYLLKNKKLSEINEITKFVNSISLESPQMESDIRDFLLENFRRFSPSYLFLFRKEINYHTFAFLANYSEFWTSFLLKKNRSIVEDQNKRPILKLVFAPKNLTELKIHPDCFSISNSVLDDMGKLSTIIYDRGHNILSTNLILNFPNYNHLYTSKFNQIEKIKILGNYTYMEERTFSYFESLRIVEFSETTDIYFIPKFAFLGCKNLQKINIPSSCIMIGEGAFKNCVNLISVKFLSNKEQKLEFIFDEAFYNCTSLESILVPPSILIIKNGAFMNCSKLKQFKIDHSKSDVESLTIIEKNSFKNCISLESFNLPQTCMYLGPASFMNCANLKAFICNNSSLISISCRTFCNCKKLTTFKLTLKFDMNNKPNISENLEYAQKLYKNNYRFNIYDEAFMNCISLKNVTIQFDSKLTDKIEYCRRDSPIIQSLHLHLIIRKTQKIHKNAFKNCEMLSNLRLLMANLEYIDENAFEDCSSLKMIETNSIYWPSLKEKCLNMPNDLHINLINNDGLNEKSFTITHQIKKQVNRPQIAYKPKEPFLNWPIPEDKTPKIKLRSTCINVFDEPKIAFHRRTVIYPVKLYKCKGKLEFVSDSSLSMSFKNAIKRKIHEYHYYSFYMMPSDYPHFYLPGKIHGDFYFSPKPKYNYPFDEINHVKTEYNYNIPVPRPPLNI